jgi:hypothetical protein
VELDTGKTCDQLDILVVSAGGKGRVSELSLLLSEMGVNPIAIYDWDAALDARLPYFSSDAIENDDAELSANLDAVLKALRSNPSGRKTKPQKILEAMRQALIVGENEPSYQFSGSVLDMHVRKLRAPTKIEASALPKYVAKGQIEKTRNALAPGNIWIWKSTPEFGLIRNENSAHAAESVLRKHGQLTGLASGNVPIATIQSRVHSLAHEPLIFSELVNELWNGGNLSNSEPKKLVRFVLERSGL